MQIPSPLPGDDTGYEAWLRYDPAQLSDPSDRSFLLNPAGDVPEAVHRELRIAASQYGHPDAPAPGQVEYIRLPSDSGLGEEGFRIEEKKQVLTVSSETDAGFLYATYALLKRLQCGGTLKGWQEVSSPAYALRILNHWDDPKFDHTLGPYNVTRGFAGNSIFDWEDLGADNPRIRDYARLMAAAGFNATCINNVNADPDVLESTYLPGIQSLADELRPYNLRLYLSVCFSAPMVTDGTPGDEEYGLEYPFCMRNRKVRLGCLDTADPRDPSVQKWWAEKAAEIYQLIPDFGGFVIKANSEGMPGPQDYGCTHAEGANCIAAALEPYGGTLFWRTFVYQGGLRDPDFADRPYDGTTQAFLEFTPLDGEFADNVILQTKNGPADFRAHEPPSPLFGAVPNTRQAIEVMAAQEYLGHTTHVCYQAEHWKQILDFDTCHQGKGSTVSAVTSGRHGTYRPGAFVAIPNLGDDANWFGHRLAGANLYAAGRLAWCPESDSQDLAMEWIHRSFTPQAEAGMLLHRILTESYRVFSRYAAPLGMGAMHEPCHHYEPSTHRWTERELAADGIGTDRTVATGTGFIGQYHPDARGQFEDPERCPQEMKLFFHRLNWNTRMAEGRTLSDSLSNDRKDAVKDVKAWLQALRVSRDAFDPCTFAHLYERLYRQWVHAGKWRDVGLKAIQKASQSASEETSVPAHSASGL